MMQQTTRGLADKKVLAAINAATWAAIEKARQTGTNVLVWENGRMVEITPDEAAAQMREDEASKQ